MKLQGLQRIGVVQPLPGIGDMIWHLPHLRAIAAHAGCAITLITKPRSAAALISGTINCDLIAWLPPPSKLHDMLRARCRSGGSESFRYGIIDNDRNQFNE